MSQTSGSITIDTSGMAASIAAELTPVFATVGQALADLNATIGSVPFSEGDMAVILAGAAVTPQGHDEAALLAGALTRAGYALVRLPQGDTLDLTEQLSSAAARLTSQGDWNRS